MVWVHGELVLHKCLEDISENATTNSLDWTVNKPTTEVALNRQKKTSHAVINQEKKNKTNVRQQLLGQRRKQASRYERDDWGKEKTRTIYMLSFRNAKVFLQFSLLSTLPQISVPEKESPFLRQSIMYNAHLHLFFTQVFFAYVYILYNLVLCLPLCQACVCVFLCGYCNTKIPLRHR